MNSIPKAYTDDAKTERQPQVTQVRVAPTRLPVHVRPRLARLAARAAEVCSKAGATLLTEVSLALEIALLDLAGAELRASSAEARARRAEAELAQTRKTIAELQTEHARAAAAEFEGEPTAARDMPVPIATHRAPAIARSR